MIPLALLGASASSKDTETIVGIQQSSIDVSVGYGTAFDPMAWYDVLTSNEIPISLYLQGDLDASGTAWTDQSGAGHNGSKIGAGTITYNATALNGRGGLTFDGSSGFNLNWDVGAPSVEPLWWYIVAELDAATTNGRLIGGNSNNYQIKTKGTTSAILHADNGTPSTDEVTMTVNQPYVILAKFGNTTDDYIKVGATGGNRGTALGNNDSTTLALGIRSGALNGGRFTVYLVIATTVEPGESVIGSLNDITAGASSGYGTTVEI